MEKIYKPHQWGEVKFKFNRLMPGIPFSEIYDRKLTVLTGRFNIDIDKLEDILARMFPDESLELSMEEIIERHYGAKAVLLIEELL